MNEFMCAVKKHLENPPQFAVTTRVILETALATGNLIAFWGEKLQDPPTPRGRTWAVDVYAIDGVILYNVPPAATMDI